MDYDEAYARAVMWLKAHPGENRKVVSIANGFQVIEGNKVLVEFVADKKETDDKSED
ncbi:MAG: hypothetical protein ACUVWP_00815 [bacterium]